MPPHFGSSWGDYRTHALRKYGEKCSNLDCNLTLKGIEIKKSMLDVHHKDGDRSNNSLTNLEVLCVWCHALLTRALWKENS